jgi:hypothetical protein
MKNTVLFIALLVISSFAIGQDEIKKEQKKTQKQSSIVFKSTTYDFGTLKYDEEAKGEFEFKNVSKAPIILTNVRASCGCTGTDWPREEVKKRKKASISVTYDTKRVGKFHKNVYVYIDGNPNPIQLQIKGEVLPNDNNNNNNTNSINTEEQKTKKPLKSIKSIHKAENKRIEKSTTKTE